MVRTGVGLGTGGLIEGLEGKLTHVFGQRQLVQPQARSASLHAGGEGSQTGRAVGALDVSDDGDAMGGAQGAV